jgi:acyl carrier protein
VIEEKVRHFIVDELDWDGSPDELTAEYPLLDRHVVDSLGIFHLVSFLESEFGVDIGDEELVPENFGTIGAIARLVETKRAS